MSTRSVLLAGLTLALAATACQPPAQPLTDADRAQIEAEVTAIFETVTESANAHDPDRILAPYAQDVIYSGDGVILEGWDALMSSARAWHEANRDTSFEIERVIVTVLTRDLAVLTASYRSVSPTESRGNTITDVFKRTPDGWTIINEHESAAQPQEGSET